jgi:uncharacterized protein
MSATDSHPLNVLGEPLAPCGTDPITGWYRDGLCRTGPGDVGLHLVAAVMTREFLDFSRAQGNDLTTPRPALGFPGLAPGDRWCVCVSRWLEAEAAGVAPPVRLEATHVAALAMVPMALLRRHAID